jgi:hypothetical protein
MIYHFYRFAKAFLNLMISSTGKLCSAVSYKD